MAKYVGSPSSKTFGLDYKQEFSKIRDFINSQIDHPKEQESKRENSEVVGCEKKEEEPQESGREVESEIEKREVAKGELELQEGKGEFS